MIKKIIQVIERKALKVLSYVDREKYKNMYPQYLRKLGINIPEDYRDGNMGFIDPNAHFDGNDYSLISIGKNTTISTGVDVLTHDYSIAVGLKSIDIHEPKARFLKPVKIGSCCFIGERVILLPGAVVGDNCIIGSGSIVSGKIPANSVAAGAPCRVITQTDKWTVKHVINADMVDIDIEELQKRIKQNDGFDNYNPH